MMLHHPFNGLDKFKNAINTQLGQSDISVDWWKSEYCDRTFIVLIQRGNTEIEINMLVHPDCYTITTSFPEGTSNESAEDFIAVIREKLDACMYY